MADLPSIRRVPLAPYASDPQRSRGRLQPVQESPTRTPFQRDRDRIIHSTAFRRLKHKTQVFVYHEGDHYRTRLTHTIEVSQIARSLARALYLDEDLAEAVALAHDLGHPPFGHAGEDALDARMAPFGGFDHNAQSLRIVTELERRYAEHDGLNLTWETLEGIVKHNGPLLDVGGTPAARYSGRGVAEAILDYNARQDLELASHAGPEAQAAAVADDVAYNAHDLDDGLRAGLFALHDLREVPFLAGLLDEVERRYPGLDESRAVHEVVRRIITVSIEDVIASSAARLAELGPGGPDAVRRAGRTLVTFSDGFSADEAALKAFLFARMYRHERVALVRERAKAMLQDLFGAFASDPATLPPEWRALCEGRDAAAVARVVCDYIAGMTDRYAVAEHQRLFDVTPQLG